MKQGRIIDKKLGFILNQKKNNKGIIEKNIQSPPHKPQVGNGSIRLPKQIVIHEALLRKELVKFRMDIEKKYNMSLINKNYKFPRNNAENLYDDDLEIITTDRINCNIHLLFKFLVNVCKVNSNVSINHKLFIDSLTYDARKESPRIVLGNKKVCHVRLLSGANTNKREDIIRKISKSPRLETKEAFVFLSQDNSNPKLEKLTLPSKIKFKQTIQNQAHKITRQEEEKKQIKFKQELQNYMLKKEQNVKKPLMLKINSYEELPKSIPKKREIDSLATARKKNQETISIPTNQNYKKVNIKIRSDNSLLEAKHIGKANKNPILNKGGPNLFISFLSPKANIIANFYKNQKSLYRKSSNRSRRDFHSTSGSHSIKEILYSSQKYI